MKKRILAAFAAAMALVSMQASALSGAFAASGYDLDVTVDLNGPRKSISPYIYGINDAGYLDNVNVNVVRQGGNRYSAYNWENNYSNAGSDWKNSSDTFLTTGYSKELAATPGACAIHLSEDCVSHNIPYKMATIQMAGYASADAKGEVTADEAAPSARWKQVKAAKGSEFSLTPDLEDDYVYMDEYVNYLVQTLGDASTAEGINGYNLDNEPALWSHTHSLMHPDKTTYAEMVEKSTEYATAIKAVDPKAEIFGLALFGFGAYTQLSEAPDADNSYNWFISYYLDKMADAEKTAGKRLIDAIDVHYYSEAMGTDRVTNCNDDTHEDCIEARLQAPRTLYEVGYIENSWIGQWGQSYLPILPNIQDSINKYYPGTKLAMTEYNFGGGDHVSGAIAEADTLGVFASNDVYLATLWPLTSNIDYQLAAINLYTNYDGNGAAFGDTLVSTKTSDVEKGTAYAAIDGSDESKVTLVLTNKDLHNSQNATIKLNGDAAYSSAAIYGITSESSNIQLLGAVNDIADNTFTIEIPALSVVQIEISSDAFTLMGDVNADAKFDLTDVVMMQKYILKAGTLKDWNAADMNQDGERDVFDLALMKKKLLAGRAPEETEWSFEEINTATWKAKDGVAGKTVTCTVSGKPGYATSWGYGYWDNTAEEWIQGEETGLGNYTLNSKGEATFSFDVPENAVSLQVQAYYYAYYDTTLGESVEEDLDGLEMLSMTVH